MRPSAGGGGRCTGQDGLPLIASGGARRQRISERPVWTRQWGGAPDGIEGRRALVVAPARDAHVVVREAPDRGQEIGSQAAEFPWRIVDEVDGVIIGVEGPPLRSVGPVAQVGSRTPACSAKDMRRS